MRVKTALRPLIAVLLASVLAITYAPGPKKVSADAVQGYDIVTVREDGVLSGGVTRAVAQASRRNGVTVAAIGAMTLQQVGVRRGETYERYGSILPVGLETWPETYGALVGIDATLIDDRAVVSTQAAQRWNVKVGDDLVIMGWKGETVDIKVGQLVDERLLQNSEIVLWDKYAKHVAAWVYPDRIVAWGPRASLVKAMSEARMPVDAKPDIKFKNARVETSWGPQDPNTPLKPAELKNLVGEYKYIQIGRAQMDIDDAWERRLQNVTIGGNTSRCAPGMQPRLNAAWARATSMGLMSAVDTKSFAKFGGCFRAFEKPADFYLRTSRPSVRAWGTAFEVRMKLVGKGCDMVRAFRSAGFAWTGTGPRSLVFQYTGRTSNGFFSPKCS